MNKVRNQFNIIALLLMAVVPGPAAWAQSRDEFPFSIMQPEPGSRRAPPPRKQAAPPPPAQARPARPTPKTASRPIRRGSSGISSLPTYRSVVTPLGTAPSFGTAPSMANPASPSTTVPGISAAGGGPALTPPRPAGQSFQDRASNCIASGTAQGVGAGQIGNFTANCVNR